MKCIFACGGTGGHITPALAIANTLRQNLSGVKILFVGTEGGMENEIVSAAGYPILPLRVKGISRKNPLEALRSLYLLRQAVGSAKEIISEFSPDIVIGTGSYACYPICRAAIAKGVPVALHESNATAGRALRSLAPKASRVWLHFEDAARTLPRRASCLAVGNPVDDAFFEKGRACVREGTPHVLSFGGSLGAAAINRAVLDMMALEAARGGISHTHATGKREYEAFMREFGRRGLDRVQGFTVSPFLSDMAGEMARAHVVISRAGAMSISEIAASGRASILIPSPNVTGDHQTQNAAVLAARNAAVLLPEESMNGNALFSLASTYLFDPARREEAENAVRLFYQRDATRLIFEDVLRLVEKKREK